MLHSKVLTARGLCSGCGSTSTCGGMFGKVFSSRQADVYKSVSNNLVDESKGQLQTHLHEASMKNLEIESETREMQLKLGLSYSALAYHQARAEFEQTLCQDLSNASGLIAECFVVKNLLPGSILVNMQITSDPSGKGPAPRHVLEELCRQLDAPKSPLLLGKVTCYTEAITDPSTSPPGSSISANIRRWPPPLAQEEQVLRKNHFIQSACQSPRIELEPPTIDKAVLDVIAKAAAGVREPSAEANAHKRLKLSDIMSSSPLLCRQSGQEIRNKQRLPNTLWHPLGPVSYEIAQAQEMKSVERVPSRMTGNDLIYRC